MNSNNWSLRLPKRRNNTKLPHARYGVDLSKVPDTYIEPFVAYRAWNWTAEGITSLNGVLWTAKQPFEATCTQNEQSLASQALSGIGYYPSRNNLLIKHTPVHRVPDPNCTCGMYAGINMQHLIDINYIQRGIHGEVHLWGRLYRHSLGWRAQFAYPRYFVVPMNMIPVGMKEAQERLKTLTEFGVDIYLQREHEAKIGQEKIPLWIAEYGFSQQGLEVLLDKRRAWYTDRPTVHTLAAGDRIAVINHTPLSASGIGIIKEIFGDDVFFTLFNPHVIYRKSIKEVAWNERNWRWETQWAGRAARGSGQTSRR